MNTTGRTLTSTEEAVLKNDLTDIQDWVDDALNGKINNSTKRMISEWRPILTADESVESIPANDVALIALIVARDDYKTRVERDAADALPE
tara:strand:- start:42 stop:314 length:273 start_codon:yes stop_codon:yes gene_type:complete